MAAWITALIEQRGYLGIVLLMIAENVFPPLPSEVIMPLAGYVAARGDLNAIGVVLAGTTGSMIGTMPWYFAGRWMSAGRLERWASRHGRLLTVAPQDLQQARRWFERRGSATVFFGRLLPAVRTVISAPAGLTCMPLARFLLWSSLGSLLWVGALVALGHVLGAHHGRIAQWLDPATKVIVGLALAAYIYRVITFRKSTARR